MFRRHGIYSVSHAHAELLTMYKWFARFFLWSSVVRVHAIETLAVKNLFDLKNVRHSTLLFMSVCGYVCGWLSWNVSSLPIFTIGTLLILSFRLKLHEATCLSYGIRPSLCVFVNAFLWGNGEGDDNCRNKPITWMVDTFPIVYFSLVDSIYPWSWLRGAKAVQIRALGIFRVLHKSLMGNKVVRQTPEHKSIRTERVRDKKKQKLAMVLKENNMSSWYLNDSVRVSLSTYSM